MIRWIAVIVLLCLGGVAEAKPPSLTPRETKAKVEEVLKAHASYKKLTPELMERALFNFLEELDGSKTYFLTGDIEPWLHPSQELIHKMIEDYERGEFALFEEIHAAFVGAIARRNELEKRVAEMPLPTGVLSEEFLDLEWATGESALEERLLRIRSLQAVAADQLKDEGRDKFFQRLSKRRTNREAQFLEARGEERRKTTLVCVLKAITAALDTHTTYFTPSEANQFMIQVQQRLFGIGAQLRDNLDGLSVTRILENSPASRSQQLKIHDKIIAVNGEPILGLDISESIDLIRGEKGSHVILTVLREGGEKLDIDLVRGEIVLEESRLDTSLEPYGDGVIATLRLFSFYQDPKSSSAGDVRKALEQVKKEHVLKGVILDLRGNAGGLLAQAVSVSGLFIQKGIVCSIKDHTGKLQHLRELEGNPVWEGPLAILTNRASASSAEIVAQALQDYGRALVIGDERTFGKGSFQTFTLDAVNRPKINPQGEYKVTRGRYYTVSGKSPQLKGVGADIVVPGILSEMEVGEEFAKYPLTNDEIEPHFEDDLSDVSPFHRLQLGAMYQYKLQPRLSTYQPYLVALQKNSKQRIEGNKNYQSFLTEIKQKHFDADPIDVFGQTDLQWVETMNILKDLVFLMEKAA